MTDRDTLLQGIADDVGHLVDAREHSGDRPRCVWAPCQARQGRSDAPLCDYHVMRAWQEAQRLIGAGVYEGPTRVRSTPADGRVYFIRFGDRIKIGWSGNLLVRFAALPHDEVIGSVSGTRQDEARWHLVFADLRSNGEWFWDTPELRAAIAQALAEGSA